MAACSSEPLLGPETNQQDSASQPDPAPEERPPVRDGMWIGSSELAALPTSGPAWRRLLARADAPCGSVALSDQEQQNNVCVMAKALVYARTGDAPYLPEVLEALGEIAEGNPYHGRALALGRELAAYVIAADLVGLEGLDPELDVAFRAALRELLRTHTSGGPSTLVECHERRPNNWGTHCGASRAAVAAYLGDGVELARVARVFHGWLGDRSAYAGSVYGDV
ncbi:MAG TPA: hypothetical protein VFQ22_14435, partial [Longimicrobiales bacterium]|nr:hypothetical protein [Longimicrobiales bacterium]